MMRVLPQSFYESKVVQKVLRDGLSCVIYKEVAETTLHKEGYVSTHAVTLVLKGILKVEHETRGVCVVRPNEMIFLPKGVYMVSDCLTEDEPFVAVVFFFEESLINDFINSLNRESVAGKCVPNLIFSYSDSLKLFTETLLTLYRASSRLHYSVTRSKLFEFLHLLSISERGEEFIQTLLSLKTKEKRNIRDFMNANFYKPLSVEDYAYLSGRSLSTFNRDFKRQFNISPKKWLMDKRLEKARELLSSPHHSVTEVALEVGYENFSHFIKAFHKKYGISPKQFLIQKRSEILV